MATGALPFRGPTPLEVASAILKESPIPLPARVSPMLRRIVQRCLAKEPGQRYQTAGEVRAAFSGRVSTRVRGPVSTAPGSSCGVCGRDGGRSRRDRGGGDELEWLAVRLDAARIRSIAVLPLENLSGNAEQEYFADGMTEQLTADLSSIATPGA